MERQGGEDGHEPVRQAHDGQEQRSRWVAVEATVTVTIRMPTAMVEALKREAEQQNVRGYQTLMKRWIEDRLTGDRVIAARRLGPVVRHLETRNANCSGSWMRQILTTSGRTPMATGHRPRSPRTSKATTCRPSVYAQSGTCADFCSDQGQWTAALLRHLLARRMTQGDP